MGEVQEQRYKCKICEKSCVSGMSLGGHMRIHLALISASKKAAKAKAKENSEIKMEINGNDDQDRDGSYQLRESSRNQSNSTEENGDQNSSYELRDNPKKTWRFSDSKHRVLKKEASCKKCGKGFPSLKALSGHMKSHSIKNKVNICKTCGKGFDSMRAMFGHTKTHSKKSKVNDESTDSLSDWESLCLVRGKRSRIRNKINPNPSSLNGSSSSGFCDLGEVQEAASCLMLLSRGVYGSVNALTEKNVSKFGDGSSIFAAEDETKVVSEQLDESLLKLDSADDDSCKKTNVSDHGSVLDKNSSKTDANDVEISRVFENKPEYTCTDDSKLEIEQENGDMGILSLDSSKSKEHECPICFKVFSSGQALGGHKRVHYTGIITETDNNEVVTHIHDLFDLNFPVNVDGVAKGNFWWAMSMSH